MMYLSWIIIINYLLLIHHSSAIWFGGRFSGRKSSTQETSSIQDERIMSIYELTPEERIQINHGINALQIYSHKEDCFKTAALTVKRGCRLMSSDELEKIKYTIKLTMCEIATANINPPVECLDESDVGTTRCVEFLSKVPQFWTSYSGYLREVVNMCFAIRYTVERELLVQLHRNITINQLVNYNILKRHQQEMIAWRVEELARLENLEIIQNRIEKSVGSVESATAVAADHMDTILLSVRAGHEIFNNLLVEHQKALESIQHKLKNAEQLAEFSMTMGNDLGKIIQDIGHVLIQIHEGALAIKEIQTTSQEWMLDIEQRQELFLHHFNHTLSSAHTSLQNFITKTLDGLENISNKSEVMQREYMEVIELFSGWIHAVWELKNMVAQRQKFFMLITFIAFVLWCLSWRSKVLVSMALFAIWTTRSSSPGIWLELPKQYISVRLNEFSSFMKSNGFIET